MPNSPYNTVAAALKLIIESEFASEQFVAIRDRIHESLGRDAVDIGIYPIEDVSLPGNELVQETSLEVRFYDLWTQEIDPKTVVDPTRITDFAQRFRDAVRRFNATDPGTGMVWYFSVTRITYPPDPTGNNSRFVATVRAFGNNAGLVETAA